MTETLTTLATAEEVDQRIEEMAKSILERWGDQKPLFVSLLRGAAPFTAKLMFAIVRQQPDFHPEVDYMTISTYGNERSAGESHVVSDLRPDTVVSGREIIVLDDVLDQGHTAEFAREHFAELGASAVHLIVLAQKDVARENTPDADVYGFLAPDKWLVGMGMDNASIATEAQRWLESIHVIEPAHGYLN